MLKKPAADVTIIAPNYNNGKYLKSFIMSVLDSTFWPVALIVINDGSTDESQKVLESFSNVDFLKVIHFASNVGLTTALNAGLDAANSKYIMRADPDDMLLPDRIEKQYQFLEQHPEIDVVGCNVLYFRDEDGSVINKSNFPLRHDDILKRYIRGEHGIQHPTAFIRGSVYKSYRYQKIFPAEDYEIFSRMARDGCRFANIAEPLYLMRVHKGSSTSNIKISGIRQTFKFRDEIFGTKTSRFRIWVYFCHIRFYRNYQLSRNPIKKYGSLLISLLFNPNKLIRRLVK